jgi:transposase
MLSPEERATVEDWSPSRTLAVRLAQRSRMILMAAAGLPSKNIAIQRGISRPTVQLWRERFLALRKEGLEKDAPRPGQIPRITERTVRKIVEVILKTKPTNAMHWSTRTMAKAQGVSEATVRRI